MTADDSRYERIYRAVRRVPPGRVSTYGRIAAAAGLPGQARQVGYALYALPSARDVPWHRVVNHRGEVSRRRTPGAELEQRLRLETEGIRFDARGRIDLTRYVWDGRTAVRTRPPRRKR